MTPGIRARNCNDLREKGWLQEKEPQYRGTPDSPSLMRSVLTAWWRSLVLRCRRELAVELRRIAEELDPTGPLENVISEEQVDVRIIE